MVIPWLILGSELVRILIPVLIGAILYRKFVAPSINEALVDVHEAAEKITMVAKLAGVKAQEYKDSKAIEKVVAADLIQQKLPELEALRIILSPSAWEQIEETIAENPEAVLQLYEKYGHLLGGEAKSSERPQYG